MGSFIKSLNEKQIAFIIIFLIAVVYLHLFFLGKIDTPVDIRNVRMYPWRYYAVDKKIKNVVLWEGKLQDEQSVLTAPLTTKYVSFRLSLDRSLLSKLGKLSDVNYYFSFDFKPVESKHVSFDLGIKLINKITQDTYVPGVAILPLVHSWH